MKKNEEKRRTKKKGKMKKSKMKKRKMKTLMNNEKMKKFGITRKIPDDFQGLPLLLFLFFVGILDDFHDFVSECVSFQKKMNNPFWGVTFFPR